MRAMAPLLALLLLAGCASSGVSRNDASAPGAEIRREAATAAAEMRGQPYAYGGESPAAGFDCSGLVRYAYRQAGVDVPRTTRQQYKAVQTRALDDLERGDVIFFRMKGAGPSHVGVYLGDGAFVHALNGDHPVRVDNLEQDYWQRQVVRAGSFRL